MYRVAIEDSDRGVKKWITKVKQLVYMNMALLTLGKTHTCYVISDVM